MAAVTKSLRTPEYRRFTALGRVLGPAEPAARRAARWLLHRRPRAGLLMWFPEGAPPPAGAVTPPYSLRTYVEGDIPAWLALLNANGQLQHWDRSRLDQENATAVWSAQFFVVAESTLVATCGVHDRPIQGAPGWEIGWVAAHPEHAGHHLGRAVTAVATAAAQQLPRRPIYLYTDDFRIAAIKTYLRLGFLPDLAADPSYQRRWERVYRLLGPEFPGPTIDHRARER